MIYPIFQPNTNTGIRNSIKYPVFQPNNNVVKNTTQYPIFESGTTIKNQNKYPIFGQENDNPLVEPFSYRSPMGEPIKKTWEELGFGQKLWEIEKQVPGVLRSFLPEATREVQDNPDMPFDEKLYKSAIVAPYQFAKGILDVSVQAVGGIVLGGKQLITGKPEEINIPYYGDVSSYQVQKKNLTEQGFSDEEAMALVGINAYLGLMPLAVKGMKTKTGQLLKEKITTKEVPFAETPEGIKAGVSEPLIEEAIKYESAEEFVNSQKPVYRASEKGFDPKLMSKEGTYVSPSENIAGFFNENKTRPVENLYLSPSAKGLEWKDLPGQFKNFDGKDIAKVQTAGAEWARKRGYDVIYNEPNVDYPKGFEWQVLNSDILKTKFQLTDLYNKAIETTRIERPVITDRKRVFGQTKEQQHFNQLLQEHTEKFFEGRETLLSREEPLNKALVNLSEKELENYSKFTQGFQVPRGEITPKLTNAVELWKKVNAEEQAYLIKEGKLTPEQIENRRWKPVETITGRTRAELKEMGVDPQYYPYLAEDLLKKSDFLGSKGRRTKGGYLKKFTGKMLQEDSYIKNPKIAIPRHRMQVFRDKMNKELVEGIRDNFAERDPNIIELLKRDSRLADQMGLEEWKPSGSLKFYPLETAQGKRAIGVTKKVESHWIPKDVASELRKFSKPGMLEKVLRNTYDPLIDMWRVSVLNLVPRWLYNNFVGNTILASLAKTDPLAFIKSGKEIIKPSGKIPKGVFMKEYAGGEMPTAGRLGSLSSERTQFLRPIENWLNLLEQAKNYKILKIPAIATQGLIRGWIALGKPIGFLNKVTENWFRGAVYISKTEGKFLGMQLDKPVPPVEGIKYVNEFLFDYTKLSRMERMTFRRALPFYNWMKNITEFSLKFPAKHPLRGMVVGALLQDYVDYINDINQAEDKTKSFLRIKLKDVVDEEGKPMYLNVNSAIPFSDVF